MQIKKGSYTITPEKTSGLFKVVNNLKGTVHLVDTIKPDCKGNVCVWKFTKKNKKGVKRLCRHIKICRGLINPKIN